MSSQLFWLSAHAQDVLQSVSQLLKGAVPSPATKLVAALKDAEVQKANGLLGDAAFRGEVAAALGASDVKEISDKTAAALVEVVSKVLDKRAEAAKARAAPVAKALASKGPQLPKYADVQAALNGESPGEALKHDWLLWHAPGSRHSPDLLPPPAAAIATERIALAAVAGSGAVANALLQLHVLQNLDAYIAYETSLPSSKPPAVSDRVKFPFDEKLSKQVAVRRVLASALSGEVALEASEASGKLQDSLAKKSSAAASSAIIPLYAEPPAPKEAKPKEAKEGKEKEEKGKGKEGKEGKEKEAKAGSKKEESTASSSMVRPTVAYPAGPTGDFLRATANVELQWQLFAYQQRPKTALAEGATVPGRAGRAAPAASSASSTSSGPRLEGFAGLWAPVGGALPPGHTVYSWSHQEPGAMSQGFPATWTPPARECPPGHTTFSWSNVLNAAGAA